MSEDVATRPVAPMLAVPGPLPDGAGWAFEFKWDGVRVIAETSAAGTTLSSRNLRDITATYPELRELAARDAVLDGEIVALDERGAPDFSLLQSRMHVRRPSERLLATVPVHLYLFDVLEVDGRALTGEPYHRRREMLEALPLTGPRVRVPPSFHGAGIGADVLTAAADTGLEGVVAKRWDSPYLPGRRSRLWVKTPLDQTAEVVIAGWEPGAGRRAGMIGSLLLGAYDEAGRLVYVGHVGTGFTHQALAALQRQLAPLERTSPPFDTPVPRQHTRTAHWVEPQLVGEVVFRTRTPDARLRHPSWRGLRPDKEPADVRRRG